MSLLNALKRYPALSQLIIKQLEIWPEHLRYLEMRFNNEDPVRTLRINDIASKVLRIIDNRLTTFCTDYRWMCENYLEEEIYFARKGQYRYSSFAEVNCFVYSDDTYMSRYVNCFLLSQIFWQNHALALDVFRTSFLPGNIDEYTHLEVGPGHGLFLALAAGDPRCASVTAWDVSPTSIAATTTALAKMGINRPVKLEVNDILEHNVQYSTFDSIVISEVLEHLEHPEIALRNLYAGLCSGGRIFINIPINSPAPDHIYHWGDTNQVEALITNCGFVIESSYYLPLTGWTLERASRQKTTISCVIFATKR